MSIIEPILYLKGFPFVISSHLNSTNTSEKFEVNSVSSPQKAISS